jgi:hypothetical protein
MVGKIPTWWENSIRGNRKTVGKIPPWWEISLSGRKKVFRCMDHLVLRHPSYMRGFTYPFSLSVTDFAALCLTDFLDWRYIHSWLVFSTQFMNCCPPPLPWTKELYLPLYLLSDHPHPCPVPKLSVQYIQTAIIIIIIIIKLIKIIYFLLVQ